MFSVTHHFHCGYFCRYCGTFNIGGGYVKHYYLPNDDEQDKIELDTSTYSKQSKSIQKRMDHTIEIYDKVRKLTNEDQKIGFYNAEKVGKYIKGTCSACGKTQPWAKKWVLRPEYIPSILSFFECTILIVGGVMSLVFLALMRNLILFLVGIVGTWLLCLVLDNCRNALINKIRQPQLDERERALRAEMMESPYYKQSYPYLACKKSELDLSDERAQRMAVELWPDPLEHSDPHHLSCASEAHSEHQRQ